MASQQEWLDQLSRVVPGQEASRYAAAFSSNFLPIKVENLTENACPFTLGEITEEHLKEMGVAIGHRGIVRSLFADIRRSHQTVPTASFGSPVVAKPSAITFDPESSEANTSRGEDHPHAIVSVANALGVIAALHSEVRRERDDDTDYFSKHRTEYNSIAPGSKLRWIAMYGERTSADDLKTEAKALRAEFGFPAPFLDRAFKDDCPMPFFLHEEEYSVFLMRIPEEGSPEDGTTIRTITNRVVLLFREGTRDRPPVVVTYHRFPNTAFKKMHSLWATTMKLNTVDVSTTAKEFFSRILSMYKESIVLLESRSEEAEAEPEPELSIEKLSLIQKQASVYARCLTSFQDVMKTTKTFANFESFADELAEVAMGLDAKAMEVSENANTTLNLKMALDSYRGGVNMKYFTYLSIVTQPVGVATGWFGMNFSNMPELAYVNTYFIFCGCILALIIFICVSLWWLETGGLFSCSKKKTMRTEVLKKIE